jgi:Kef-type K+ transport system membrane component KefB
LLLFIIGLGLNPRVVREVGSVSLIAGLSQVVATTVGGFFAGKLIGLNDTEAVFFGFGLAISSTIIILKLLSDKRDQSRLYGKIAIGMSLVEDVAVTIALLIIASRGSQGSWALGPLLLLAFKGALIGVPMYWISTRLLPKLQTMVAGSQEFLFLLAMAWGFGSATLFEAVGFSLEVGALFAGICWATLPYAQEVAARLRPLRDFFIIVFFISLGSGLVFDVVIEAISIIIVGVLLVLLLKPLAILTAIGLLGYTKQTSFKTAISMTQISEFSLIMIVLGLQQGLVSEKMVGGLTVIAIITIAISTYLIMYSDQVFGQFEQHLSLFERRKTKYEQEKRGNYELVLIGYQRGGHEFVKVFKQLKRRYVVIDYDPDVIDMLESKEVNYLYGDVTDIEMLEEAGIQNAKMVVSTITDHEATLFLLNFMSQHNPKAVLICHADSAEQANQLYELGASYVMIPHYIGSEKISAFIKKYGLKKSEFKKFREKHLVYLEEHHKQSELEHKQHRHIGHAILDSIGMNSHTNDNS